MTSSLSSFLGNLEFSWEVFQISHLKKKHHLASASGNATGKMFSSGKLNSIAKLKTYMECFV